MLEQRTILLVEDGDQVRVYLTQLLQKHHWRVTALSSGVGALAALAASRFDIVLCDLDLGAGINGVDVLKGMPEASRATPFVILTGHGTIDRYRDAIESGATDFLEKPIAEGRLFSSLDRAMGLAVSSADAIALEDPAWREAVGDRHVRRVLQMIGREFSKPELSVEDLAKTIPVTSDHLARLFRKHLGRAPLEKLHEVRTSMAAKLLDSSTLSMYEIAVDCGYRSTTEFASGFGTSNT